MKTKLFFIITFFIFWVDVIAQTNTFPSSGAAGIGTVTPDSSAKLEIKSTNKGLLIPRMTQSQRNAISRPATSLLIYQTDNTAGFYYYTGSKWKAVSSSGWSLTGNSGTTSSNFLGTTDAHAFKIKVNNQLSGYIDYDVNLANTGLGYQTLSSNTGFANTAVGYDANFSNSNGAYNTSLGAYSLYSGTTGSQNTALGTYALYYNSTGYSNTTTGYLSLISNVTGSYNTADGWQALTGNTSGNSNTAIGAGAMQQAKTGYSNVAVGSNALFSNQTSSNIVAVGDSALFNFDNAYGNTAVGSKAGYTTQYGGNSYFGWNAGYYDNAASNTAIGSQAGWTVANSFGCTYLGAGAGPTTAGFTNTMGLGYNVTPTASNQVWVGNTDVTSIGGEVGWTSFSDGRYKKNIKENVPGLAFINQLKPITYTLDISNLKKSKGEDKKETANGAKILTDNSLQEKIIHTGFIAQDVEAIAKKMNYDFDGVDAPKNDKDFYGLRYSEFVVPLVKAVQELSAQNDSLKNQNINLTSKMDDLQNQINQLKSMIVSNQSMVNGKQSTVISSATLQQNIPNPFTNSTTINYSLPQKISSAKIIVTDKSGKALKEINISGEKGSVNVNASTLSSGAYQYSLYVDGKKIDTKQMERIK